MVKLNSGWKRWDRHLSKLAESGRPLHMLEIGSYEGDATLWMLNNLAKLHPNSSVTCIDTWEGSPEYEFVNFKNVEKKWDENIAKSGLANRVTKIKAMSFDGLVGLLSSNKRPVFDMCFIDASHEARDVLADAIMCWRMLRKGGVLIFDDYLWKKLKPDYFCPRPAIDAFIQCMKPELTVLEMAYQAFVEKKMVFEEPKKASSEAGRAERAEMPVPKKAGRSSSAKKSRARSKRSQV